MILIAIIGFLVNFLAAYFTKDSHSLNTKSVNLHMLEDVLGWIVVLIGSVIIKFTNIYYIDSIMSIGISIFLIIECIKNIKEILNLILEKTPKGIDIKEVENKIKEIKEVKDVHHIHIWTLDGEKNYATMHIVTNKNVKEKVREKLKKYNIHNVTIETEKENETCNHKECE